MITWWKLWPLLALPFFLFLMAGVITEPVVRLQTLIEIKNVSALFREWSVNTFVMSLLSAGERHHVIDWYMQTSIVGEVWLHVLISINIAAVSMPFMVGLGYMIIKIKTYFHVGKLDDLRQQVKQH